MTSLTSESECANCCSKDSFVYDSTSFLTICEECGLTSQDFTDLLRESDYHNPSDLIKYGNTTNSNPYSTLLRNRDGTFRNLGSTGEIISKQERKQVADEDKRKQLHNWIRSILFRLQQTDLLSTVTEMFDHVKRSAERRYQLELQKELDREREREVEGLGSDPDERTEPAVLKKFKRLFKPLRWGRQSDSIACALILLTMRKRGGRISMEELAAATNEPTLSLQNLRFAFYHTKFLLGPNSEFASLRSQDKAYDLERFSFGYLDFWVEQVGLKRRKEGKDSKDRKKGRTVLIKEVHDYLRQAILESSEPSKSGHTSTSNRTGTTVQPKTISTIKGLISNLSTLVYNHSDIFKQTSPSHSELAVGFTTSYAITMLAIEGFSKSVCPQNQFVLNQTVNETRKGAERLTSAAPGAGDQRTQEGDEGEDESENEEDLSKSASIKSRYVEIKRFLQEVSKNLPWLQLSEGGVSRDENSRKREWSSKKKQKESKAGTSSRDLNQEAKIGPELSRKELAENLKEIVNYGIKALENERKERELRFRAAERDQDVSSELPSRTWVEKYSAPNRRRKLAGSKGTVVEEKADVDGDSLELGSLAFEDWIKDLDATELEELEMGQAQDTDFNEDEGSDFNSNSQEEEDEISGDGGTFLSREEMAERLLVRVWKKSYSDLNSSSTLGPASSLRDLHLLVSTFSTGSDSPKSDDFSKSGQSKISTSPVIPQPHPGSLPEFSMELETRSPDELDSILFAPGELESCFRSQQDVRQLARIKSLLGDWEVKERGKEKEKGNSKQGKEKSQSGSVPKRSNPQEVQRLETESPQKRKKTKLNFSLDEFWEKERQEKKEGGRADSVEGSLSEG